jgi:hypothetical protein
LGAITGLTYVSNQHTYTPHQRIVAKCVHILIVLDFPNIKYATSFGTSQQFHITPSAFAHHFINTSTLELSCFATLVVDQLTVEQKSLTIEFVSTCKCSQLDYLPTRFVMYIQNLRSVFLYATHKWPNIRYSITNSLK